MLRAIFAKWSAKQTFGADAAAKLMNDQGEYAPELDRQCGTAMREFLFPNVAPGLIVTPKAVSKRLRSRVGEPVPAGKRTLVLQCAKDPHTELLRFWVEAI
jgi:hypothetical protein